MECEYIIHSKCNNEGLKQIYPFITYWYNMHVIIGISIGKPFDIAFALKVIIPT